MAKLVPAVFLALALTQAPRLARAEEPQAAEAPLDVVARLRGEGDLAGAASRAADLVHAAGAPLEAHVAYQNLMQDLGRETEMELEYRRRAQTEGATADDLYLLARLWRGAKAITQYRAALKADAGHFQSLVGCANELLATRDLRGAENSFEAAKAARPASGLPWNGLGRVAEARGDRMASESAYRKALTLSPKLVVARVNLGVLLVADGRQKEALEVLDAAAKLAPRDPLPLIARGVAETRAGNTDSAVLAFETALAVDGRSVATLTMLATTYVNLDRIDLAAEAVSRALAIAPKSVAAHVTAATFHLAKLEVESARAEAQTALGLDDGCAMAHFLYARCLDRGGDEKKAEGSYRRAVKIDGANAVLVRGLAQFLGRQGRWKDAVRSFQRVVDLTNVSPESLYDLGLAQVGASEPAAAAATFETLVAVHSDHLDGWLKLGIVCRERLRQDKRALAAFRSYVERGGTDARVTVWIAEIEKTAK